MGRTTNGNEWVHHISPEEECHRQIHFCVILFFGGRSFTLWRGYSQSSTDNATLNLDKLNTHTHTHTHIYIYIYIYKGCGSKIWNNFKERCFFSLINSVLKNRDKSKFSLALLFKPFFIKIQPNMSEQEKKRQRIYDLLNVETKNFQNN